MKCAGIAHSFCAVYIYYVLLDCSLLLAAVGYHTTVTVLSTLLSLVMTLSLSTCTVTKLRHGELCSSPRLSQSLLWSSSAASLHAGGGDSVRAGPEGEGQPTREKEEEDGAKMQANPAYLPTEMSYKSQESKSIFNC